MPIVTGASHGLITRLRTANASRGKLGDEEMVPSVANETVVPGVADPLGRATDRRGTARARGRAERSSAS
jgi:hypothetical protein